ncbi:hypothetical protein B0H65DRAFT_578897 [Neurospora tetraspora]|uniref:Uncharacterized protein n=1 Tax=Neurospora tetraspora TaxID=94610 RepID=A0AAE0JCL5_9PEZI|nr:hypothetical protein B0H65DRAFT_578897 [Neurospora tetraspora]
MTPSGSYILLETQGRQRLFSMTSRTASGSQNQTLDKNGLRKRPFPVNHYQEVKDLIRDVKLPCFKFGQYGTVKFLKLERSWGDREPGTVSGPRSNVAIDEKPISSMGIDTIRHHINGNTELLYALDHEYLVWFFEHWLNRGVLELLLAFEERNCPPFEASWDNDKGLRRHRSLLCLSPTPLRLDDIGLRWSTDRKPNAFL